MPSDQQPGDGWSRRSLLRRGAAVTASAGVAAVGLPGRATRPAAAHNLKPGSFGSPALLRATPARSQPDQSRNQSPRSSSTFHLVLEGLRLKARDSNGRDPE